LGPADFGTVAVVLSANYFLSLVVGPYEAGLTQSAASVHGNGAALRALAVGAFGRLGRAAAVLLVVVVPAAALVTRYLGLGGPLMGVIFVAYLASSVACSLPRALMRGDGRFHAYGFNQGMESCARLVVGGALVWTVGSAESALGGYVLGIAGALAFAAYQLRDVVRAPKLAERPPVSVSTTTLFYVYLYAIVLTNADLFVAKRSLSAEDAGLYGSAATLARMLFMVAAPIYTVLFSRVATSAASGVSSKLMVHVVVAGLGVSLFASVVAVWWLGPFLLRILFGAAYVSAAPTLAVLWATTSLLIVTNTGMLALAAAQRTRGSPLFLLPCILFAVLLTVWRQSTLQIATAGLVAAACGLGVALLVRGLSGRTVSDRALPAR
jgi:O-antigen/teichoic acid export membrane protein